MKGRGNTHIAVKGEMVTESLKTLWIIDKHEFNKK